MSNGIVSGNFKLTGIKAVVFDVYGTLVEIREKRSPYKKLLDEVARRGRLLSPEDKAQVMTQRVDLIGAARLFGVEFPTHLIEVLEQDLHAELKSISLYADVLPTLISLRQLGYKMAVCSNLAMPYANPVEALLPFFFDEYAWSFDVGVIKPQAAIYENVCSSLACSPNEIVMIGDTIEADYDGPRRVGMHAFHLDRKGGSLATHRLNTLDEILSVLS